MTFGSGVAAGWHDRRRRLRGAYVVPEWVLAAVVGLALGLVVVRNVAAPSLSAKVVLVAAFASFVAMVVGTLRRLLLTVVIVDIAFRWDVNLFYREDAAALGALGGFNISATTLALTGLYALWLAELLARSAAAARPAVRAALPLLAFTAVTALSLVVARDRMLAGFEVELLVELSLLFLYVASTVRSEADVRFVATMLVVVLLLAAIVIAAGGRLSGLPLGSASVRYDAAEGGLARAGGTIGSPNAAGTFLAFLLAPALVLLATPISRRWKALASVAFAVGLVALVLTFSRGGWLAFGVSIALLGVVAAGRRLVSPGLLLATGVAVAVLLLPFYGLISARLAGGDASAESRGPLMALAWEMVRDRPLLGVGANNFVLAIPDYAGPDFASDWLYAVHNKFLQVWAEAGTAALLAFVWFLAATIGRGWRVWRAHDPFASPLALALAASVVGQVANMFVETYHARPQMQLLCVVAALLAAMSRMQRAEARR